MKKSLLSIYLQPRLLIVLVLGFVSGLPPALCASTLFTWLTEEKIDLTSIGLFAAVSAPYSFKFIWSPLVDGLHLPLFMRMFGKRRGWLIATQILLMIGLICLGFSNPNENLFLMAIFALLVATASATQDIIIDAYRIELLTPEEQGAGAAIVVLGYRIGMIVSAAGALFLSTAFGWQVTYAIMAALVPVAWLAVIIGGEPTDREKTSEFTTKKKNIIQWGNEFIIEPFADFMKRESWLAILLFIILYKFGDAFMGVMTSPFLIQIGFTKNEIATVAKLFGLIATIAGSLIGGVMVARLGIMRSLWICGIAQALTNFMFIAQARMGADEIFLIYTISLDNITGGMGTTVFVAYISGLVNLRFTATQYALLSSFSAFGRTLFSTPAGWFAEKIGWESFFILSAILAVPGLLVLWWLSRKSPTASELPAEATSK